MKKLQLAILSGLLLARSFPGPGVQFGFLAWFFLVPFLIAIEEASWKKTFWLSLAMGATANTFIGEGLWVVLHEYFGIPFAKSMLIFMSHGLILASIHWIIFAMICRRFILTETFSILFLPLVWACMEFLYAKLSLQCRGVWVGYSQHHLYFLFPLARIFGMLGLTYFVVWTNFIIYGWLRSKRKPLYLTAAWSCLVLLCFLIPEPVHSPREKSLKVALLQTNMPHALRPHMLEYPRKIQRLLSMSREAIRKGADLILWPASSVRLYHTEMLSETMKHMGSESRNVNFLLGATLYEKDLDRTRKYNTIILSDQRGRVKDSYQKIRLTPFTDYFPLGFLDIFGKKKHFPEVYSRSRLGLKVLEVGALKAATPICVEAFYPELISKFVKQGSDCIIHFSNDSIYQHTNFPYLMLAVTKMRCVEFGLPALRESIDGISAIIAPSGKIYDMIPYGTKGILIRDFDLQAHFTLYAEYGIYIEWTVVLICIVILIVWLSIRPRFYLK